MPPGTRTRPKNLLSNEQIKNARAARQMGKAEWLRLARSEANPYPIDSFLHYCWVAGYHQDVATEQELYNRFNERTEGKKK